MLLLANFMPKVRFWEPFRHPVGIKMTPQIRQVAPKWSKNKFHALTFWGSCGGPSAKTPSGAILVTIWGVWGSIWASLFAIVGQFACIFKAFGHGIGSQFCNLGKTTIRNRKSKRKQMQPQTCKPKTKRGRRCAPLKGNSINYFS